MKLVCMLIAAAMMLLPLSAMADVAIVGPGNITCNKLGNDLSNPAINGTSRRETSKLLIYADGGTRKSLP